MTVQKSLSDISPTKSHTKWPFYVWLDSLITTVSTPSNPEYELCLPPFRVVRRGLIRLVLVLHGLSVSDLVSVLKDCYKL